MSTHHATSPALRPLTLRTVVALGEGPALAATVFTLHVKPRTGPGAECYRLGSHRVKMAKISLQSAVELARAQETLADPLAEEVCFELQPGLSEQPLSEPALGALRAAFVVADRMARGLVKVPQAADAATSLWLLATIGDARANHWQLPSPTQQVALWQHLATLPGDKPLVLAAQALQSPGACHHQVLPPLSDEAAGPEDMTRREATVSFALLRGSQEALVCPITVWLQAQGGPERAIDEVRVHNDHDTQGRRTEDIKRFLKHLRMAEPDNESDRHWLTHVVLPDVSFSEQSYELALAVADRMARGREWCGAGRVFATGRVNVTDMPGRVETVANVSDGLEPHSPFSKVMAFRNASGPDDCILLPDDWLHDPRIRQYVDRVLPVASGPQQAGAASLSKALPMRVHVKNVFTT